MEKQILGRKKQKLRVGKTNIGYEKKMEAEKKQILGMRKTKNWGWKNKNSQRLCKICLKQSLRYKYHNMSTFGFYHY